MRSASNTWPAPLRGAALAVVATAFALAFLAPEIAQLPRTPGGDGRFMLHQIEIAKASLRAGEAPLFNPFDCRGIPQWEHPEGIAGSPLLLLMTPLSGPTTFLLWELVYVALGFAAMWRFARAEVAASRVAAALAAALWAGAPALTIQIVGAHATFHGFYLFPWLLLAWRRAERDRASAVALGVAGALLVFEGASYPLPMCLAALVVEAVVRVAGSRDRLGALLRVVRAGTVAGLVAVGLSAARLFPLAHQLTTFQRRLADDDPIAAVTVWDMFFAERASGHKVFLQTFGWHEYGAYLGATCAALAIVGAGIALRRRRGWLVALAVVLFVAMLGDFGPYAPWRALKHLPPFSALRVPSRFRLLLMLPVASFVALATDGLPRIAGRLLLPARRVARVLAVAVASFGVASCLAFASGIVGARFWQAPPAEVRASPRFYYGGGGLTPDFIDQPRQNRAWTGCRNNGWRGNAFSPVWEGDVPPARVASGDADLMAATRGLGSFRLHVMARAPSRVHLASGYDAAFRASVGAIVGDGPDLGAGGGRILAVDLPPGEHHVVVRYWPRYLSLGIATTTASSVGLVIAFAARRRRRTSGVPRKKE